MTPHNRTLEVRPGRITKKLELKYDYDCERDDTNSLLGVLMFGWDVVIANNDTYLSILVDGFRVQSRGDHGWPPLACGILSNSSDIEGCRAVVSGVIWIRLLDSARLM